MMLRGISAILIGREKMPDVRFLKATEETVRIVRAYLRESDLVAVSREQVARIHDRAFDRGLYYGVLTGLVGGFFAGAVVFS